MEAKSWISPWEVIGDNSLEESIRKICSSKPILAEHWHIEYATDTTRQWIRFQDHSKQLPSQGWKLHISASLATAQEILQRVLPILLAEASGFKVAASLEKLLFLNQGNGGISQVGKFITVYPCTDQESVHLARLLDTATRSLGGPNVPSDRVLSPGSRVYYRYGGFDGNSYMQTPIGFVEPALQTPDKQFVPDRRIPRYDPPEWAIDPFLAAGMATPLPLPSRFINGRYLIITTISTSISHTIYLGVDIDKGRSCVIKGPGYAWRDNSSDATTHQGLLHEADILRTLTPDEHISSLYDVVEENGNLYLILQDIEGKTLAAHITDLLNEGKLPSTSQVIVWGSVLAEIFASIHARGIVYGDVKSSNVIIGPDGHLSLIDFELAHKQGDDNPRLKGRGTRVYMSPQQARGDMTTVADDIYSLGALLYFMATGVEVFFASDLRTLLEHRPLELVRPGIEPWLTQIILRCLHEESQERYSSMIQVKAALEMGACACESLPPSEPGLTHECEKEAREHYRQLARELMHTLCEVAERAKGTQGMIWRSTHHLSRGIPTRDINIGNGGTVLALAELLAEYGDARAADVLAEGACWLKNAPVPGGQLLGGLYVGEGGAGAALLRTGQVLHDETWVQAAAERSRRIAALPHTSPDLFHGTAGRLRFHLLLWDETGEAEHLTAARVCGEHLLEGQQITGEGEVFWPFPPAYGEFGEHPQPGYAHGAAGIADALLDLFEATNDDRFVPAIQGAGRWLLRLALPALEDHSGLTWPRLEGGPPTFAHWCHGATGIGRFFLHASQCDILPEARDIAERAARTVARSRWLGSPQCHGLAGNIEFLLDMYQVTGDRTYLTQAFSLGRLLEGFRATQNASLVFSSEAPNMYTPDYMVGYAGIAVCLLRLAVPTCLPHQLSRAGFRAHRTPIGEDLELIVYVP